MKCSYSILKITILIMLGNVQCALAEQNIGTQPADIKDKAFSQRLIYDLNLILKNSYKGMFELDREKVDPHPEIIGASFLGAAFSEDDFTGINGAIAFKDENSLFVAGRTGSYQNSGMEGANAGGVDSISEYKIPSQLLNNSNNLNDRTGISIARQTQPWSSVFRKRTSVLSSSDRSAESISGLYYDRITNLLCLSTQEDYDTFPHSNDNMLCYEEPNDLANSNVKGYFSIKAEQTSVDQAQHAAGWFADIPREHHQTLGGRTLFGGGGTASVIERLPIGPTLFAGSLDNLGLEGHVSVKRSLDYDDLPGRQLGAYYFTEGQPQNSTWYSFAHFNCDPFSETPYICGQALTDSSLVQPWINDFWTIESYAVQGFILPGTDTYIVIGQTGGAKSGISYKGFPDWRKSRCPGACLVDNTDLQNHYWLYDLKDILSSKERPWEVFPYEHGSLPFLDSMRTLTGSKSIMINAGFDLTSGRLAVVMRARAGSQYNPNADVLIFQNDTWQESLTKRRPAPPRWLNATTSSSAN